MVELCFSENQAAILIYFYKKIIIILYKNYLLTAICS
jgi:hypothetical protein